MNRSKVFRLAILFVMSIAYGISHAVPVSAHRPPPVNVRITPIGRPTWKPTDFNEYTAPIGTADDGYAEFFAQMGKILPPPNHEPNAGLGGGIGPGVPHPPPYITEISKGLIPLGYRHDIQFTQQEFSNGMGVYISWMTVPVPWVTGSSPDFDSGPIIPNTLFPITISGITYHNGNLFNPYLAYVVVPSTRDMDPAFLVDGHSHFPMWIADNADFGPPGEDLSGSFEYALDMTDQTGAGWHVSVRFTIAP